MQKTVMDGASDVSIGTNQAAFSVIPENIAENTLSYRYVNEVPLAAPIEKGQRVSTLEIWCGNVCLSQCDLYALNSVKSVNSAIEKLNNSRSDIPVAKYVFSVLGVLVGVVIVALGVLYVLRVTHIARKKRHRHRNSMYRRRSR